MQGAQPPAIAPSLREGVGGGRLTVTLPKQAKQAKQADNENDTVTDNENDTESVNECVNEKVQAPLARMDTHHTRQADPVSAIPYANISKKKRKKHPVPLDKLRKIC